MTMTEKLSKEDAWMDQFGSRAGSGRVSAWLNSTPDDLPEPTYSLLGEYGIGLVVAFFGAIVLAAFSRDPLAGIATLPYAAVVLPVILLIHRKQGFFLGVMAHILALMTYMIFIFLVISATFGAS